MEVIYQAMVPVSKLAEGILFFLLICGLCRPRFHDRKIVSAMLFGIVYVLAILPLVDYQYREVFVLYRFAILTVLSMALFRDQIVSILFALSLALFLNQTLNYIASFLGVLFMERPKDLYISLSLIRLIDRIQLITIGMSLAMQVMIWRLSRSFFQRLQDLPNIQKWWSFTIIMMANLVEAFLMRMITRRSVLLSQTVVILLWVFMILVVMVILMAFLRSAQLTESRMEHNYIMAMNRSVSQGYQVIAEKNEQLREQAHDFRHHLMAIRSLESDDVLDYVEQLLEERYTPTNLSNSGDRYIDAVLNSKMPRISNDGIEFQ